MYILYLVVLSLHIHSYLTGDLESSAISKSMHANFSGYFKNSKCQCISKEFQKCGRQYMYMWRLSRENNVTGLVRVMVFKATFNDISVISWRSVLLLEESGVPGVNHRHVVSHGMSSEIL